MENKNGNSGVGVAILLGAMVLFAFNARADVPRGVRHQPREVLVWADGCPDNNFRYDGRCKKRVYIDDSVSAKDIDWGDIDKIAREVFKEKKSWVERLRDKFKKVQ